MDSNKRVSPVFIKNPQRFRLKGRQKTGCVHVYKQILINAKFKTERRGKDAELTGRNH